MSEWQPIETAPKDGQSILTYSQNDVVAETRYLSPGPYVRSERGHFFRPDGWYWSSWSEAVFIEEPTHWMPLPAPPKEADNV